MDKKQPTYPMNELGRPSGVSIKSPKELDLMREAGQIVGRTLQTLRMSVEPGMETRELDAIAERDIVSMGGKPAFKGYRGFPPEALLAGSIGEVADEFAAFGQAGFTDIVVRNASSDQAQSLATIEALGEVKLRMEAE